MTTKSLSNLVIARFMLASRGDLIEEMYKSVRFYYRRINIKFLTAISLLLMTFVSHAHESRPAYLELKEQTNNVFDVQWRRPARGDMVLRMQPVFPAHCVSSNQVASYIIQGASIERCPCPWDMGGRCRLHGTGIFKTPSTGPRGF